MKNKYLVGVLTLFAVSLFGASFSTLSLKNQYGEVTNSYVVGGSSKISAKFYVDSTNSNGQRSLLSNPAIAGSGISKVFMHTTATPAAGNPNPSPGYIIVQFARGYSSYVSASAFISSPTSLSSVNVTSGLSQGKAYVIQTVGTTTPAQWQFLGLPANLTPTPSQAFIAITGGAGSGTGTVGLVNAAGSTVGHIEIVGAASLGLNTVDGSGGQIILQVLSPTNSSTTTLVATAPLDNSVIELTFSLTPIPGSMY